MNRNMHGDTKKQKSCSIHKDNDDGLLAQEKH